MPGVSLTAFIIIIDGCLLVNLFRLILKKRQMESRKTRIKDSQKDSHNWTLERWITNCDSKLITHHPTYEFKIVISSEAHSSSTAQFLQNKLLLLLFQLFCNSLCILEILVLDSSKIPSMIYHHSNPITIKSIILFLPSFTCSKGKAV